MVLAMVPKPLARINQIFKFLGEKPECKTCEHRDICVQNLKPGKYYKITEVRDVTHECPLYGIEMKVVEVIEVDIPMVIDFRPNLGEVVKGTKISCNNTKCQYYAYCLNPDIEIGEKYEVSGVEKEIDCPLGRKLYLIYVKRKRFPF